MSISVTIHLNRALLNNATAEVVPAHDGIEADYVRLNIGDHVTVFTDNDASPADMARAFRRWANYIEAAVPR